MTSTEATINFDCLFIEAEKNEKCCEQQNDSFDISVDNIAQNTQSFGSRSLAFNINQAAGTNSDILNRSRQSPRKHMAMLCPSSPDMLELKKTNSMKDKTFHMREKYKVGFYKKGLGRSFLLCHHTKAEEIVICSGPPYRSHSFLRIAIRRR